MISKIPNEMSKWEKFVCEIAVQWSKRWHTKRMSLSFIWYCLVRFIEMSEIIIICYFTSKILSICIRKMNDRVSERVKKSKRTPKCHSVNEMTAVWPSMLFVFEIRCTMNVLIKYYWIATANGHRKCVHVSRCTKCNCSTSLQYSLPPTFQYLTMRLKWWKHSWHSSMGRCFYCCKKCAHVAIPLIFNRICCTKHQKWKKLTVLFFLVSSSFALSPLH